MHVQCTVELSIEFKGLFPPCNFMLTVGFVVMFVYITSCDVMFTHYKGLPLHL